MVNEILYESCLKKANMLIKHNMLIGQDDLNLFQVADLLYKLEIEKIEKEFKSDTFIDFNDEIISITDVGVKETIDISVSGDNLFYCNGILTKNSFGLPATVDMMFTMMRTEELDGMKQILVKQLKSRFNDINRNKKFVIGVEIEKFRFYDVDTQSHISDRGREDIQPYETVKQTRSYDDIDFD